jgi:hypothetical protein
MGSLSDFVIPMRRCFLQQLKRVPGIGKVFPIEFSETSHVCSHGLPQLVKHFGGEWRLGSRHWALPSVRLKLT